MSTWFVNSEWAGFIAFPGDIVVKVDVSDIPSGFSIETADALSAPTVEQLLPAGLALWPRGAAWGTPDGEAPSTASVIANLTRSILDAFARLYAMAWRLTEESRSATLVDSIEDWERDFGLPDPCATEDQTFEQRKKTLQSRVMGLATITPADVVKLAAGLGYMIAIEEPDAFLAGESECLSSNETSNTALEQQWVVHIQNAPFSQFEAGIGEVGVTRLLDFDHGALECAIRRISPAWTYVIFSNAVLPVLYNLVTDTDFVVTTDTGEAVSAYFFPAS